MLPLGTHTVSETAALGTDLDDYDSRISCVDVADHDRVVAHGTGTSLHVDLHSQAEDIVCNGHGPAHGVTVVDTPPHGLRIVKVEEHGTIPHDGRAFWHLGTVAPGETRTVHATARVDEAGVHVDDAVAIPRNGDPAVSVAAVTAVPAPGHGGRLGGPTAPGHGGRPGGPTAPPPRVTG